MSKAMIVLDMPKSCDECSFETEVRMGGYAKSYCGVPGCGRETDDYIACRAEWCPLVPVPKKKPTIGKESEHDKICMNAGFNACIDAICGKE